MTRTILCLLLLGLTSLPVLAQKAPKIRASDTGWDFGVRKQGEKDVKTIKIFNDGDAVLKIYDIKLTCGCVRGDMEQREIAPGESADLELVLTTYRNVGLIRKHCYLYTNDPKMKQLILTVEGDIKGDWELEHNQINFGECEAGMPYTQSVKITQRPGQKLKLLSIETFDPNLEIKTEPYSDPETGMSGWIATVKLLETAPAGPFAAAIAVRTTHRLTPLQNLMVYAKVVGPIKMQPLGKIHMGRVFEGAQARRNLRISIDDGAGYLVTEIKVDCPAVEARLTELDPGRTWDVEFIVTGRAGDSNMHEIVVIKTNHPLQREIKMGLNWVTRPKPAGR